MKCLGTYPIRPTLPATGGGEGVAEILSVGDEESDLRPGDWVIPARPMVGTWRSHIVSPTQVRRSEIRSRYHDILSGLDQSQQ